MVDMINHPPHYNNHPSGVECIEITKHMNYCLGNAIKYIWRADLKADAIEDLKKAIFYLNAEVERRSSKGISPITCSAIVSTNWPNAPATFTGGDYGTNKEERPREVDFSEHTACDKSIAATRYYEAYHQKRSVRDSEY